MKSVIAVSLLFAGCAGARYAERTTPLPPPPPPAAVPAPGPRAPLPPPDEAATRAWLDQEIERNRWVPPPPPPEVALRIVERPVWVGEPGYVEYGHHDPYYGRSYHGYGPYREHYRHGTTFPLHTAFGAGLGAVIGHQSGHRGRGAWIGGSLGLLMDLGSHW